MFGPAYLQIDKAHALLIYGLIVAQKPERILEFGLGGGMATDQIISAISFNQNSPQYTVVDNWADHGGQMPKEAKDYPAFVNFVTADEKDFVSSAKEQYDFILSDADHYHTHEWFEYVYVKLLAWKGVLIYHDINLTDTINYGTHLAPNDLTHLRQIYEDTKRWGLSHYLFNKSTRADERCERGLLVIFKV